MDATVIDFDVAAVVVAADFVVDVVGNSKRALRDNWAIGRMPVAFGNKRSLEIPICCCLRHCLAWEWDRIRKCR